MDTIKLKAYAKLNLDLIILGILPNGYHSLLSTMQAIDLTDTLEIRKMGKGYELTGSLICGSDDNLVSKAKKSLEEYVETELPCSINLVKGIPVGSGLGGGSSDAACALIGLTSLYDLNLKKEDLLSIGVRIGADVPFFIHNYPTAKIRGIGEHISVSRVVPSNYYVLARPHLRKSTKEMYRLFDETRKDFLTLTREMSPQADKVFRYFEKISNYKGVSGSGPTIFAGFEKFSDAQKAIETYGISNFNGDFFIVKPAQKTYEVLFN